MERFSRDESPFREPSGKPAFLRGEPSGVRRMSAKQWDAQQLREQMVEAGMLSPPETTLTRRNFLLGVGATIAAVGIADWRGKYSSLAKFLDDALVGQYDYDAVVKEAKALMREGYGIDLIMGPDKGESGITGDKITLERYRTVLRVITEEMSKYPPSMTQALAKKNGLEIRVLDNLQSTRGAVAYAGSEERSEGSRPRRFSGLVPALAADRKPQLLLSASEPERFLRQTVHHELNHIFARSWEDWALRDKRWVGLHAKVSQNPYRRLPPGTKADEPPKERYFLTYYASGAPVEDQATTAEWMMTPNLMAEFIERWRTEPQKDVKDVLAAKYITTKQYYAAWSGGKIGDAFWNAIIDQGYRER